MNDTQSDSPAGQRGPAEHNVREQIISAANEHFSHYGYAKTTIADLAREIGFSKAYIYRFFASKQAIGEAICAQCLSSIADAVVENVAKARTATMKLRALFKTVVATSVDLFFTDRKLYDIAGHSAAEGWQSADQYYSQIREILERIILEGRESGEFERKTPLDETCRAILQTMQPFMDPLMLERNLASLPDAPNEVVSLILRSLAP